MGLVVERRSVEELTLRDAVTPLCATEPSREESCDDRNIAQAVPKPRYTFYCPVGNIDKYAERYQRHPHANVLIGDERQHSAHADQHATCRQEDRKIQEEVHVFSPF
jgi:hypothetical protein